LGGGIGFHGWIAPWDAGPGQAHLSWGCVVMQPDEIGELYGRVSPGTMVVIF
jgi:lipoprotein-anchoring transpeptidase ErfK/SrfK